MLVYSSLLIIPSLYSLVKISTISLSIAFDCFPASLLNVNNCNLRTSSSGEE